MKTDRILAFLAAALITMFFTSVLAHENVGAPGGSIVKVSLPTPCDLRLSVNLTPDVPDPRDVGFLSSLLSDHVNYRLIFRGQRADSVLLELTGPGPDYRCQNVVQSMRKDARVVSVQARRESL